MKEVPPKKFSVARIERVYESKIQFVELELTGYRLSAKRVNIPNDLLVGEEKAFRERLRNSFLLLQGEHTIKVRIPEFDAGSCEPKMASDGGEPPTVEWSEDKLENERKALYDDFLINVPKFGQVIMRRNRCEFDKRVRLFEAQSRLRFPSIAARPAGKAFDAVASATLQRKKLWIEYHARSTNERTERTISPQRIAHYRETWYLDAWDEDRNALRSFSIDRILRATTLHEPAFDVAEAELDDHYASAYGIFGGKADKIAVLRFSPEGAKWVADEKWHPEQQGEWLADGSYELKIPYRESRELVMDIMRHGPHVEVVAPANLRDAVAEQLQKAARQYE